MLRYDLLPDTEIRKDIPQQIIRRDLAGDLAEVVQGLADVHGHEVVGDPFVEAAQDGVEALVGATQSFVVAGVGHHRVVEVEAAAEDGVVELFLEVLDVHLVDGGDGDPVAFGD